MLTADCDQFIMIWRLWKRVWEFTLVDGEIVYCFVQNNTPQI